MKEFKLEIHLKLNHSDNFTPNQIKGMLEYAATCVKNIGSLTAKEIERDAQLPVKQVIYITDDMIVSDRDPATRNSQPE